MVSQAYSYGPLTLEVEVLDLSLIPKGSCRTAPGPVIPDVADRLWAHSLLYGNLGSTLSFEILSIAEYESVGI